MKAKMSLLTLAITLVMTACAPATPIVPTPDVLAVRTSAAYTVVAEFTLTAAAFTPTRPCRRCAGCARNAEAPISLLVFL
jgi:hypothetical protein